MRFHAKIDDAMVAAMEKMTPEQQREQVALMEQAMLADRFKLRGQLPDEGDARVCAGGREGWRKGVVANGDENRLAMVSRESGQELTATGVTMEQFAQSPLRKAQPVGGHPVVNQTSLKGRYDFTLRWSS